MNLKHATILNRIMGVMLVVIGVLVVASPIAFIGLYGAELATSDARSATRAGTGAVWLALGVIFLFPKIMHLSEAQLLRFGAILFCAVLAGRFYHMLADSPVSFITTREIIFEAIVALVFLLGAMRHKS